VLRPFVITLAVASAVSSGTLASAAHAADAPVASLSGGQWGKAQVVRAPPALPGGGAIGLLSVSCGAAGYCSAGGRYTDRAGRTQAIVVNEVRGRWGRAHEVPGSDALNKGGDAAVAALSCASARSCSAGGSYAMDHSSDSRAFVVGEVRGSWGKARDVPGLDGLNAGNSASVTAMSCASAGNCSAGGQYLDGAGNYQAFVVGEVKGVWGPAEEVPGSAVLNAGGGQAPGAGITSVSCSSAGDCAGGGFYTDGSGNTQAFVVNEQDGGWGGAIEVPGSGALNQGFVAEVDSMSCASDGNCALGGSYQDDDTHDFAFVDSETAGTWNTAEEVPGTGAMLKNGPGAQTLTVSCGSPVNCEAGGYTYTGALTQRPFVDAEDDGTWGTAQELTTAMTGEGTAQISSISCTSTGDCSAGGYYMTGSGHGAAFVVSARHGIWGKVSAVPGLAALTRTFSELTSISCASAGHCAAIGFASGDDRLQAIVVDQR
jgi:hypothetical protein